jgi:hypothetical protein
MWRSTEVFRWSIVVSIVYLHMYIYIFALTWSTEHRQKLFFFRARRLPSPVGTIIVMTIQIVVRDKRNSSLASRSLSLSRFFGYGDILPLYLRLQAWRLWPSSFFLLPSLSLAVIAFASYATTPYLRANTKVVTNIRKKSNTDTPIAIRCFFSLAVSLSLFLAFFLDVPFSILSFS